MQGLNPNTNSNSNCNSLQPQIHFDSTSSNDDFLKQMLSNLPSSSWILDPKLNPNPSPNPNPHPPLWQPNSGETTPDNVVFPYDVEHANLSSKFRNHQINDNDKAASALMLHHHHHLLMSNNNNALLHNMPLDFDPSPNDVVVVVDAPTPVTEPPPLQPLFNAFSGSLQPSNSNQTHHFQHPQKGQSFGGSGPGPGQPKQRVRARRGQATDPHSIAERLRRERIAERMKALQELVPNANKTDKASMLDEIIDYVKFLQLQVKVLSMSRLGGAAAVAPLVADMSSEGGGECGQGKGKGSNNSNETASMSMTEEQVAKLMEEDMGSAMQYLQGKGLCLMPISLATAISKATCRTTNHFITNNIINGPDGPSSPGMSALTVQSVTVGNGNGNALVKDSTSVSKS